MYSDVDWTHMQGMFQHAFNNQVGHENFPD